MKQLLLLFTLLSFYNNYGQSFGDSLRKVRTEQINKMKKIQRDNPYSYHSKQEIIDEYLRESKEFQSLAQPDENNRLSLFLKANLNPSLLKKNSTYFFKSDYKNSNISNEIFDYTVRLTFNLNKKNEPYNIKLNTGNRDFNNIIIQIFEKFPIDNYFLNSTTKNGKYSVQIFAKENKKVIIKASTFAIVDQIATVKNCENNEYQEKFSCGLDDKLFEYILANISLSTLSKQDIRGEVSFYQRYSVDTNGKISDVNSAAPNKIIKDEIDRIIKSYNQTIVPATRNNIAKNTSYYSYRKLIIENIK